MFGYGWGRGFGFGRFYGWRGNPTPYCRAYPWLPRGWWKWGYAAEDYGYPGYEYSYPYAGYYGFTPKDEILAIRDTLKQISDTLTMMENRLSEIEKMNK